jgi:hypothetical protein
MWVAFARQWHGKHVSTATDMCATIEKLFEEVLNKCSVPRLYNKNVSRFQSLHIQYSSIGGKPTCPSLPGTTE